MFLKKISLGFLRAISSEKAIEKSQVLGGNGGRIGKLKIDESNQWSKLLHYKEQLLLHDTDKNLLLVCCFLLKIQENKTSPFLFLGVLRVMGRQRKSAKGQRPANPVCICSFFPYHPRFILLGKNTNADLSWVLWLVFMHILGLLSERMFFMHALRNVFFVCLLVGEMGLVSVLFIYLLILYFFFPVFVSGRSKMCGGGLANNSRALEFHCVK